MPAGRTVTWGGGLPEGVREAKMDVQAPVLVDADDVHQLRQQPPGEGLNIAVPEKRGQDGVLLRALRQGPALALHAAELSFTHPITGKTMAFTAPLPRDMAALVPEE